MKRRTQERYGEKFPDYGTATDYQNLHYGTVTATLKPTKKRLTYLQKLLPRLVRPGILDNRRKNSGLNRKETMKNQQRTTLSPST